MSGLSSVPSAPAFAGSADPRGLVRVLRDQRAGFVARRDFCPPDSPQYASYTRQIDEADEAIMAARAQREVPS